MAGYASRQAMEDAIALGKFQEVHFRKVNAAGGAGTAGVPQEYFTATGTPGALSLSGSTDTAYALSSATSGALCPLSEGNVSPECRYLLSAQFYSTAATAANSLVVLCDLLLYYPGQDLLSAGAQDNTTTLPRYTSGEGVMAVIYQRTAVTSGLIASVEFEASDGSTQTTTMTYGAAAARLTQFLRPTMTSTPPISFLPIPNGKLGVKKINQYTITGTESSTFDFMLLKPLAIVPLVDASTPTETDFANQFVSFPRIYDGACLGFFVIPGGNLANSAAISGKITYGWA